jgi:PAS domain S-box-containing protein
MQMMNNSSWNAVTRIFKPAPQPGTNLARVLGALAGLLGLTVILAWHTHVVALIQLHPALVPMQYNTALGLLLCGSALFALTLDKLQYARLASAFTVLLGSATLAQYLLARDLGIDQLLMHHYITTFTSNPGRMAPSTALSFITVGCSLLFSTARKNHHLMYAATILAAAVTAIACATFLGYAFDLRPLIGWGASTYMAIHTAIGIALVGAGVLAFNADTQSTQLQGHHNTLVIACFIFTTTIVLLLWSGLVRNQDEQLKSAHDTATYWLANRIDTEYAQRVTAIERMAQRWEAAGGTARSLWEKDAAAYIHDLPGFQALQWADASARVRWVEPLAGNEQVIGLDNMADPLRAQNFIVARDTHLTVTSHPFKLKQGGSGFLIIRPLYSGKHFDGYIVVVFRAASMFEHFAGKESPIAFVVEHNAQAVYSNAALTPRHESEILYSSTPLLLGDGAWTLYTLPDSLDGNITRSALPKAVLVGGLITALLLSIAIWLWGITAQRAEEITRTSATIAAGEARLRGLFEMSPVGIALNDFKTGKFIEVNNAMLAPSGYNREEFIALDYWSLTPEKFAAMEELQQQSLVKNGSYGPYEKEYIRKDGSRYPVLLNGILLLEPGGRRLIWSIVEDITERKKIERMKSEFVSTVSHELRTPLTSIVGALGLVNSGTLGELPAKASEMLSLAYANSKRLNLLINDLLDMEKLMTGNLTFNMTTQPLLTIVEQSLRENQPYADQYHVRLALTNKINLLVNVDALRLQQVLSNLLSNAAKFSPEHGQVEISMSAENGRVKIGVRDHGPGIPAEFRERIFQKFSQADSSDTRKKSGTGLGLAISKELIERMGGKIGFESEINTGTLFYFELPLPA